MAKSKPVHTIRLGRIKAAIWANKTDAGIRHNVTVQRLYLKDDEWVSTESFGRDDLPLVCKVLDLAYLWLYQDAGKKPDDEAGIEPAEPDSDVPHEDSKDGIPV